MRFSTTVTGLWASAEAVENRLREHRFVDVIGAAAGDQEPARVEQPKSSEVDFLVAGQRVRNRRLVLGEGRRVQDDGVVAGAFALEVAQLIEDVGFARRQVGDAIGGGVGGNPLDGVRRNVQRLHRLALRGEDQRRNRRCS